MPRELDETPEGRMKMKRVSLKNSQASLRWITHLILIKIMTNITWASLHLLRQPLILTHYQPLSNVGRMISILTQSPSRPNKKSLLQFYVDCSL